MSIELAKRLLKVEHQRGGSLGEDGQFYYKVPESVFAMAKEEAAKSKEQPECDCASKPYNSCVKCCAAHEVEAHTQQQVELAFGEREWVDTPDEYSALITTTHPTVNGDYETHKLARRLVENRHSKWALVDLVNYLLQAPMRESVGLRLMMDAPHDGTPILLWIEHENYKHCLPQHKSDWAAWCVGYWTKHNGGGWVWHGLAGAVKGWTDIPKRADGLSNHIEVEATK